MTELSRISIKRISIRDKGKQFTLRFMPDINEPGKFMRYIRYQAVGDKRPNRIYTVYITHAMSEGQIHTYKIPRRLYEMIDNAWHGYYGTPDGRYICSRQQDILGYLATPDLNRIVPVSDECEEAGDDEKDMVWFNDQVLYEPRNPYDMKSGLVLNFTVDTVMVGNLEMFKLDDLRWAFIEPLYKEGDDKDAIIKLYDGVMTLVEACDVERNGMCDMPNLWHNINIVN